MRSERLTYFTSLEKVDAFLTCSTLLLTLDMSKWGKKNAKEDISEICVASLILIQPLFDSKFDRSTQLILSFLSLEF